MQKFLKSNKPFIMKILIAIISFPFLFISVGNASELTLVWSDEFNYEGAPDSKKWKHEEGFIRNDEVGYYTSRLKNVRVEGGVLVIEAHKETYSNAKYTSGSIHTRDRKNFKYGRIEIRAKMPEVKGSHTGIWMDGANQSVRWPLRGEVDIAEYLGREPNRIHVVNHYADPVDTTQHARTVVGRFAVLNPCSTFLIYAIEWDEKQIKYFIDNIQVAIFNVDVAGTGSENPFRKEQVLHLTYALGGWGLDVDDKLMPDKFEIDYVRVYQATSSIDPVNLLLPSSIAPVNLLLLK